jgi:pimeloyl-ACP methyl ester carboxylesterase
MSKTIVNAQPIVAGSGHYVTGSVISKDGTTIGYRQLGQGPGLVVLHGAMESAQSHMQLAEALADTYTVYLPDRRGRGVSGAYGREYSVQEDVDDLDALLSKTGAHFVFGVSSGAIISLQAALTLPAIQKAAIFEPPLMFNGSAPTRWLTRFDNELAEGNIAAAMVTGMKGAEMGPPMLNLMPRWLLEG